MESYLVALVYLLLLFWWMCVINSTSGKRLLCKGSHVGTSPIFLLLQTSMAPSDSEPDLHRPLMA